MSNRARTTLSFFISILLICCTIFAIGYFKDSEEDYSDYSITLEATGTILDNTIITPNADGTISLPTPTKEGYTFDGWYVDDTKWVSDMVITNDMTLTARWTPLKYNITFVVNNVSTIVQVNHNTIPEYTGVLEKPNTEYYKTIEGGNVLSDFNGLKNTQTLVGLGTDYEAANACWNYNDETNSGLQWYLPAMGELVYLRCRYGKLALIIEELTGDWQNIPNNSLWSSTERSGKDASVLQLTGGYNGIITGMEKDGKDVHSGFYARPFAILP
jgi:uncharacterized repeat protein (TIGR02543 family)